MPREAASALPPRLLDTPLYQFAIQHWRHFAPGIVSSQVLREEVLLFLMWSLDNLKSEEPGYADQMWDSLYEAIRQYGLVCGLGSAMSDLTHLANVVSAMTLATYGLLLTGFSPRQSVYQRIEGGLGEKAAAVHQCRGRIKYDATTPRLKQWLLDYWDEPACYTASEEIGWDESSDLSDKAFRIEGLTEVDVDWLPARWSMERKREAVEQIRQRMLNAIAGYRGKIDRKKANVLKAGLQPSLLSGKAKTLPSYTQAQRLFGDLGCLPTESNYIKSYDFIRYGER